MGGFDAAFQKALAAKGKSTSSSTNVDDITGSFKRGQYASVNSDIAASNKNKKPANSDSAPKQKQVPTPQPKSLLSRVKSGAANIVKDTVKSTIATGQKTLNTGAAGVGGTIDLGVAGVQAATGHKAAAARTIDKADKRVSSLLDHGAGNKGGFLTSKQASSRGGGTKSLVNDYIKPTAQATSEVAPFAVPGGAGTKVGESIFRQIGRSAAMQAGANAGISTGNAAVQGNLNKKGAGDIVRNTILSGVIGGAIPLIHHGGSAATEVVTQSGTKDFIKNQKTQSLLSKGDKAPPTINARVNPDSVAKGLTTSEVKTTPLGSISISADDLHKVDAAKVNQYVKQIKDGEAIEPVVVHHVDGHTYVVDGQQRLAAARKLGITDIPTVEKLPGKVDVNATAPKVDITKPEVNKLPATSLLGKTTTPTEGSMAKTTETQPILRPPKDATPAQSESFAHEYMAKNRPQAEKDYLARTQQEFGNKKNNIVSGDEAKFVIPDFGPNKSVPYHEAASAFAKEHYQKLLDDTKTKKQPVLIMAGGSGAGKTSSLREVMGPENGSLDDFAAVVDTNLTDLKGASTRIDDALKSGREVHINYVYRHPDEAYMDGVVPRAARTGRVVTPEIHDNTHTGSVKTIFQIAEKYKDNPNVEINVIDNSRGRGNQTIVPLDFLKDKGYNKGEVESRVTKLLDDARNNKDLTQEQYDQLKGQTAKENTTTPAGRQNGSDAGEKSPQEHGSPGKVEPSTRTLTPAETAHMPEIGGYTHSTHMAQEYADMLRGQEQGAVGGQIVKNADGSYRRVSEHSRFYRDYYKEHGAAPTKAAYLEEARKELENGKDGLGAGPDYKKLLEREAKPVPRVKVESSVKDMPQGTSKVAKRIALDIKEQYGDLAQYDKISIADQAKKAEALIADREKLNQVISGEVPLPDGLRATSLITAVRHDPELLKDGDLLKKLASSPLASESSLSAQELRLARENAKGDPVMAIRNIQRARQKAAERRLGTTADKAINAEVRKAVIAKPKVTKETWESFVDSLKC